MKRIKYIKKLRRNSELNQILSFNNLKYISSVNTCIKFNSKLYFSPLFSHGYVQFEKNIDFNTFNFDIHYTIRYPQFNYLLKK